MRTFSSVGTAASSSRQRSSTGAVTPSTSAAPASAYHSSGSPNVALSRASRSVSSITAGVERTGPRVALTVVGDDADADALDHRGGQRLDLAAEHLDLGLARPDDVGLDLLRRLAAAAARPGGAISSSVAHAAVPPTVISRTSTVGWPDDTGTL